eukprot:CAMPEP_0181390454 /NCGR_PEP_ID=MMETSP1106-20121128/25492_1 /TAXON_ID=81844 /ORGANISM="Mantoniella antarctica, Strain SL-175" /LENGTH=84 /DNA_ID=CAMNT_0023511363 /DNA_START=379 /DNA_END=633 /DNA_ORIENTATION=-
MASSPPAFILHMSKYPRSSNDSSSFVQGCSPGCLSNGLFSPARISSLVFNNCLYEPPDASADSGTLRKTTTKGGHGHGLSSQAP